MEIFFLSKKNVYQKISKQVKTAKKEPIFTLVGLPPSPLPGKLTR